jgi:tRNA(adenine34) deaminase
VQLAATFSTVETAMQAAIDLAIGGVASGELGIGAIVLDAENRCIGARHDEVRSSGDPLGHAAVLALKDAASTQGSWRLLDCQLIVTREPCALCAGAALSARVKRLVVADLDPLQGGAGSRYNFGSDPRLNHEFVLTTGVLAHAANAVYASSLVVG